MQENEAKVEGIGLMSFRVFWFVVAGFVLGFATSTLWEWLYYRRKRLQSLQTHSDTLLAARRSHTAEPADEYDRDAFEIDEWKLPTYRSSGVLLESEEQAVVPGFAGTPAAVKQPAKPDRADDERLPSTVPARDVAEQASGADTADDERNHSTSSTVTVVTNRLRPADARVTDEAQEVARPLVTKAGLCGQPADHTTPGTQPQEEEEESTGNAQAITRVTAMAAATLGSMLPATASSVASTAEPSTVETQDHTAPTATEPPQPIAASVTASYATASTTTDRRAETSAHPPGQSTLRRPADYPDDLAMIKGIGEAYKRRLYATGLYTWRQLAESDTDALRRITRAKPNADIESWQIQARTLAEKYQRTQANFNGPLDDFTRIEGIGAITADILYKAGICTYEQLAGAMPDELALIVPAPTVGNENDFDGWINDAARLAGTKRRNNGLLP